MEQPRRVSPARSSAASPPQPWPPFSSVRKTQSYSPRLLRYSFRLNLPSTLRQYFSTASCGERPRNSASRTISSRLIQTNPGAPVQQLPHWEQVNFNPPAYQGSQPLSASTTSSFMARL